jgi:tRNA1(Val) A37 N6-methylase TrmN6
MGGRIKIFQPNGGFKVTIDPLMLAAAIPAMPGEKILDVGSGTGAASLALASRCEKINVTGLELQSSLVNLANYSAKENRLHDQVVFLNGDLLKVPEEFPTGCFNHVMANPPYIPWGWGNLPKDASKRKAMIEGSATLEDWIKFLLARVCDGGTITIIHRFDRSDEAIDNLNNIGAGNIVIFPLWQNKLKKVAKRVIIQAQKGVALKRRAMSGLVLHDIEGAYTADTEDVLRYGNALLLKSKS